MNNSFEHHPDSEREQVPVLSSRDLELVQRECELRCATTPEQIFDMTTALREGKAMAMQKGLDAMMADEVLVLDNRLATLIEGRNADGWRQTVVAFRNGGTATAPQNLPDAMAKWADAFVAGELSADELYYAYEAHQPYEDGNGRTGWVLWAMKRYQQAG